MRTPWVVGAVLAGVLLAGCGDPRSAPPEPAAPRASSPTPARQPSPARQPAPAASPSPPADRAPRVLYLGDSLAMEAQTVLGREMRRELKARYTSAPYSGTTLCDYLEGTGERSLVPAEDKAAALVRRLRPDVVVLQFWGNSWGYTPCMDGLTYAASRSRYAARYADDARRLTEQIAAAGAGRRPRIVWVAQGPDPLTPDRVRRVNALYEERAAVSGDLVADAGEAVSPAGARYTWTRYLPCTADERARPGYCTQPGRGRTALHRADDPLHFCLAPTTSRPKPCPVPSPGILRIARAITETVRHGATRPLQ
ncbi:SGNH/GDSL hydrolase family protein [Streptomyces sp. NPDC057382]|uniref:SGNH/GDSL hydrolase family protein n=1 Tax=unclassified Streptomyces TaxID=2593676 RepID=UPI0036420588